MSEIRLPALSGDSPLGILAAIGTLRLLTDFTDDPPRLRWNTSDLTAVLCGRRESAEQVVRDLKRIVNEIGDGAAVPGVGAGFPPPGAAPDGLRVPRAEFRDLHERLLDGMSQAQCEHARLWLASLVTDLAVDDRGRVAISQYTAPSGKQSMATMLEKSLELIRAKPGLLAEALLVWRRVPGVTGEYLDHRAMWDAAEDGGGSANMRGVPGATWLALMSYPLLRTTTSARRRARSSGWHTARADDGRSYDELRLPVWEQPLGPAGVVALIEHPALSAFKTRDNVSAQSSDLAALGVVHVCRARRYQPSGAKSAGVLVTIP